ncbi:MAG: hypothetical protein ACYC35_18095 [Pirellulales bacterium]|jgi:hypothetical protein
MKRFFGALMILMGIGLGAWIGYNLFVERLPEAQGKSPIPAVIFTVALFTVGGKWVAGR